MTDLLTYHKKIKDEQHVFLFAVSGRSSSTAFQRIINSSNQVWMWGEPHGVIKKILYTIFHTKEVNKEKEVTLAINLMYQSYVENKHLSFYANAVGNLDSTIEGFKSIISNFLKPWAPKVRRFGFKEIDLMPVKMLKYLRDIYPQSIFVFCFRNPLLQWPSLCKLKLPASKNLDFFLNQYNEMATTYMAFMKKHKMKAIIEDTDLRDLEKVNKIISYLNIHQIDKSLIDVTVHTLKHKKLSQIEIDKILNSGAYQSYLQMQKISQSFYK